MNNKVIRISLEKFDTVKERLITKKNKIFFVEIDGKNLPTLEEYFPIISKLCGFPIPARSWDGYNDWMTDFSWINEKDIVIVIYNFEHFLQKDPSAKVKVIEKFQNNILPWWEKDVLNHVVEGKTKKFVVYLVD